MTYSALLLLIALTCAAQSLTPELIMALLWPAVEFPDAQA